MKTDDLKAQGLTDEQITFVMQENGKDLKALQDENATLKTEKSQLENDKKVITKEKEEKEKAYNDLQKNTMTKEEYDKKIKEIEETSKKEHEDYVLNQLLDAALEDAKVLKNENARSSIKGLLDMDKISVAKDQKSLVGIKEQLESIKNTDGYFFEKSVKGHKPAGGTGNDESDDDDTEGIGSASDIAKELNAQNNAGNQKSQFFN